LIKNTNFSFKLRNRMPNRGTNYMGIWVISLNNMGDMTTYHDI
jgi:hypothetical protein